MEDGVISISRSSGRVNFPAKFMLIGAQNPCPCGYLGDPNHECKCTPSQIIRYQKRVSGPMLDRIDIHLDVPAVKIDKLTKDYKNIKIESSREIRTRVQKARNMQTKRFKSANWRTKISSNAEMTNKDIKVFCELSNECLSLLRQALDKIHLSARSYHRIIKLSRTIADLEEEKNITPFHIAEALQYRPRMETI
jgi:magnesium chelatase family protein